MAKTFLFGYVIAVSVCALWPTWMTIAALQMMEDATWRTWAEAARVLATGWLFFVLPAVLLYLLLVRLPDSITQRLNRKETERRQAEVQARARSLNPAPLPEQQAEPPASGLPPAAAVGTACESATPASAPTARGWRDNIFAKPVTTDDIARDVAEDGDAEDDLDNDRGAGAPEPHGTTTGLIAAHLFTSQPVASTFRWRLLVSFLLWPLLGCLYFLFGQLLTSPAAREHFTNGLMVAVLVSVYYTLFPLLGYWLASELLLHRWPQWFVSAARHYATALLTGVLAVTVCQWLDPALRELTADTTVFPKQDWYLLLLGAGSGVLLAAAYRIPVALNTYFGDDSPTG